MLFKSRIFYFSLSFFATFVVGFFVWNIFVSPENGVMSQVLAEVNKINSKIFTASLKPDFQIVAINDAVENETLVENLTSPVEIEIPGPIIMTDQERQNLLDDIQEKLDIISQQVQELVAEQNKNNQLPELDKDDKNKTEDGKKDQEQKDENLKEENPIEPEKAGETGVCTGQININTASAGDLDKITQVGTVTAQKIIEARPFYSLNDLLKVGGIGEETLQKIVEQGCAYVESGLGGGGGGGGGSAPVVYSKILISEVQILPISQRFVELYNPNSTDINLTGWYLQRKTETAETWSSFISSTKLEGKTISAGGYFLISRELESSDILYDITLSDSNSLAFKNPNGEISDKFGFGSAKDYELSATVNPGEGKSIGRKLVEKDTDNNSEDFEIQKPTPKLSNVTFVEAPVEPPVEPPAEPPVEEKDITAPKVSFSLNANQTELSFLINFTIADLLGTVTPSGIGSYVFRWQENGQDWQNDESVNVSGSPTSSDFIRNFTGENGKTYNFQVQATDAAGNASDWLPVVSATTAINIPIVQKSILINKIQLAGQTAKDEFIELYNPNNSGIDLLGYALKKKTSTGTESNLVSSGSFSGTISALGYFLIVPKINDDGTLNYTGSLTPDLYYSGKTYSVALNNTVLLYGKDGILQDKVGFGTAADFETAPASNPIVFEAITRTDGIDTDNNSLDFSIIATTSPTNN